MLIQISTSVHQTSNETWQEDASQDVSTQAAADTPTWDREGRNSRLFQHVLLLTEHAQNLQSSHSQSHATGAAAFLPRTISACHSRQANWSRELRKLRTFGKLFNPVCILMGTSDIPFVDSLMRTPDNLPHNSHGGIGKAADGQETPCSH